jgi:hypothetical protein
MDMDETQFAFATEQDKTVNESNQQGQMQRSLSM